MEPSKALDTPRQRSLALTLAVFGLVTYSPTPRASEALPGNSFQKLVITHEGDFA